VSPDEPDAVALAIAGAVQRRLLGGLGLPALPGVAAVRVHATGALATGIVAETGRGNRYFLVRVVEFHHPR
jgi:hypothetical protein